MNDQMKISDLEKSISEKIFIRIEKWNLYLGDAGLARKLAFECINNFDKDNYENSKLSLDAINVKIGDGDQTISLLNLVTSTQISDLEDILDNL